MASSLKKCTHCLIVRPLGMFGPSRRITADGLRHRCKVCESNAVRDRSRATSRALRRLARLYPELFAAFKAEELRRIQDEQTEE